MRKCFTRSQVCFLSGCNGVLQISNRKWGKYSSECCDRLLTAGEEAVIPDTGHLTRCQTHYTCHPCHEDCHWQPRPRHWLSASLHLTHRQRHCSEFLVVGLLNCFVVPGTFLLKSAVSWYLKMLSPLFRCQSQFPINNPSVMITSETPWDCEMLCVPSPDASLASPGHTCGLQNISTGPWAVSGV